MCSNRWRWLTRASPTTPTSSGASLIEEIRELAEPLKGRRVVHLSATAFGGGVSEILYTLVPLMRDVGLDVEWQVIYGREEFFNATKLMHNALQGHPQDLSRGAVGDVAALQRDERRASSRAAGTSASSTTRSRRRCSRWRPRRRRAWVWRCHIDISTPNPATMERLLPVHRGLPAVAVPRRSGTCPAGMDGGVNIVPPAIDPLAPKNMALSHEDAVVRLQPVRDRRRAPDDLPGLALRPVEGPAGRDRRVPDGQGGAPRRAARARRLDGVRRPGGLGLLQLDARPRRRATPTSTSSTTSTTSARSRSTPSSRWPTS